MAMARASSGPTYSKRFYAALYQQVRDEEEKLAEGIKLYVTSAKAI
ncbi:hypothetical protein NC653_033163 [Populus alba x Populus x berolinensis]|uniref:Uncharacterized protein n=1 Tax=Populus alba x Populus x berolinensis TaxID=444605 RepID=A0AAD6LTB0_9ROSI|nr:hypothetical protein NC653_033163 [Populus alba x Populus x berolinensis]